MNIIKFISKYRKGFLLGALVWAFFSSLLYFILIYQFGPLPWFAYFLHLGLMLEELFPRYSMNIWFILTKLIVQLFYSGLVCAYIQMKGESN